MKLPWRMTGTTDRCHDSRLAAAARTFLLGACVWFALHGAAIAQDDGGTQSPFQLGSGAREQAMGRTGAATSRSAEALFWNPARLASTARADLSLFRTQLFLDGSLYHAAFGSYPMLDFGTLAFGYQRLDVSGIERVDERNRSLGTFENSESSLMVGFGRNVGGLVALGGSLRVAQQAVDATSDASVGLDLGIALQYESTGPGQHWLSLGANLQNAVEPRLALAEDEVRDPRSLKLGLGYGGTWAPARLAWVAAVDVDLPSAAQPRPGAGLELSYQGMLMLRGGYDDGHPTVGLGLAYRNIRFDYALRPADALPRNDLLSLGVQFGASLTDRRQARRQEEQRRVTAELEQLLAARERDTEEKALAAADSAFAAERFEAALLLYRRVLAVDPEEPRARAREDATQRQLLHASAVAALQAGNLGQAAADFQAIVERWPDDTLARAGLQQARERLQRAADRDRNLRQLFAEALARFSAGDWSKAEATLSELLRLEPRHELGLELRNSVRAAKARAAAAKQPTAVATLAPKEHAPEDRSPAPPRRLSAAEQRDLERLYQEGLAAFGKRDFERAIRNWRAVWLESPHFEGVGENLIKAYLFEGVELYGRGQYDAALERCRQVLEIDPANEKALRYRARILEEKLEVEQIGEGRREP